MRERRGRRTQVQREREGIHGVIQDGGRRFTRRGKSRKQTTVGDRVEGFGNGRRRKVERKLEGKLEGRWLEEKLGRRWRRDARGGDGGGGARAAVAATAQGRQRSKGGGSTMVSLWPRQGVAAVAAAVAARRRAMTKATAATTVRLLPRPSVSSHSRWSKLLSFLK